MKKFNLKYVPLLIAFGIGGTALINNFGWDILHTDYLTYLFVIGGVLLGGKSHQYLQQPCKLLEIVLPLIKKQYEDNPKVVNLLEDLYSLICEENDDNNDVTEVEREKKTGNREEEEKEDMLIATSCYNDSCSCSDDDCA